MIDQAVSILRSQLDQLPRGSDTYDKIGNEIKNAKTEVINEYGAIFAPEHIPALTAEEFRSFLLFKNNRHWDSVHRQGPQMTANMELLRSTLALLVDESKPLQLRLNKIRPTNGDPMVKGLGRAVITAILQVRHPDKYGVVNQTAEDGMKNLGVWPSFSSKATFGEAYELINATLLELAKQIPTDLWTLDMLWWRVQPHVPVGSSTSRLIPAAEPVVDSSGTTPNAATAPIVPGEFGLESHLQDFLIDNWTNTPFGPEWDLLEKDGELVGSYYDTHAVGQIDLLARNKAGNRWLVVELKRNQTSDATVGQLLRYRSWVRESLANPGDIVEGVIICSDADLKLKYAIKGLDNVQCLTYKVHFSLANAELSTVKAQAHGVAS